jgi:hypothetical protein
MAVCPFCPWFGVGGDLVGKSRNVQINLAAVFVSQPHSYLNWKEIVEGDVLGVDWDLIVYRGTQHLPNLMLVRLRRV